jgi:hypothetical protein
LILVIHDPKAMRAAMHVQAFVSQRRRCLAESTRIVDPYPRIEQEQDQRPRTPLRPAPGFKSQQSPDVVLIEQGDLQVGRSQ